MPTIELNTFIIPPLMALSTMAHAEDSVYRGQLDGSINLMITIDPQANPAIGSLRYDATGGEGLELEGKTLGGGRFEWREQLATREGDNSRLTGIFRGQWGADGKTAQGSWQSADGRKQRVLTLTRWARLQKLSDKTANAYVSYPRFDAPHYAQLNQLLVNQAPQRMAEQLQTLREARQEFEEIIKESGDKEMFKATLESLAESTECSVESAQANYVSLLCLHYSSSGGAHPNSFWQDENYRLEADGTPHKLNLWDVLTPTPFTQQMLSRFLVADLKRQQASLVMDGQIKDFVQALAKNELVFTFIPAGLVFHFSPYAVASYAEGDFRVLVPRKSLTGYLRADHPWISTKP